MQSKQSYEVHSHAGSRNTMVTAATRPWRFHNCVILALELLVNAYWTTAITPIEYMCIPSLVLIAQAVLILEHRHTHSHRRHWSPIPCTNYAGGQRHGILTTTLACSWPTLPTLSCWLLGPSSFTDIVILHLQHTDQWPPTWLHDH